MESKVGRSLSLDITMTWFGERWPGRKHSVYTCGDPKLASPRPRPTLSLLPNYR